MTLRYHLITTAVAAVLIIGIAVAAIAATVATRTANAVPEPCHPAALADIELDTIGADCLAADTMCAGGHHGPLVTIWEDSSFACADGSTGQINR